MDKEYIISEIKKREKEIKDKFKIKKVYLFGSYSRNEENNDSDIDILIEFNSKYDPLLELEFQTYLFNLFKIDVGVIEKNHINKDFKELILEKHNKIEIC